LISENYSFTTDWVFALAIWIGGLLVILSLVLALRKFFFQVVVESNGMASTLENGDRVIALLLRRVGWLNRGQIVIICFEDIPWNQLHNFASTSQDRYIEHITGVPGDSVATRIADLPEPMQKVHRSLHDEGGRRIWRVPPGRRFVQRDSFGLDSAIGGLIGL